MSQLTPEQRLLFTRLHEKKVNDKKVFMDEEYIGYFRSIIDKYPESAHFVYELLQNADDANATEVSIILKPNRLIFKHNGTRHFNLTPQGEKPQGDINAITGIGFSNKEYGEDSATNKIGKFGVGFKAVFQYTDTPEIYDDVFKFKIEDIIVPTLLEYDNPDRREGETLFVFPFKQDNIKQSFDQIKQRLQELSNPLIFLNNLTKIIWRIDYTEESKGKEFAYTKELTEQKGFDNDITLQRYNLAEPNSTKHIFLFSRKMKIDGTQHKIYAGFYYDVAQQKLITDKKQNIYCFFPTQESFDTCFISHAPFLLTDNRQTLKPDENINTTLIGALASLATDAVICLRDYGVQSGHLLINENITEIIPTYGRDYYSRTGKFHNPMVEAFGEMLQYEAVLLSRNDKYLQVEEAYTSTNAIYDLLTQEQFALLHGKDENNDDYLYGYDEYYDETDEEQDDDEIDNPDIDFLKWELRMKIFDMNKKNNIYSDVADYSVEVFAKDITADFMNRQKVDWVTKFYTFLRNDAPKFWKNTPQTRNTMHVFRDAPIIKIQSGKWVNPYIKTTTPNVFLPLNKEQATNSQYNFIHEEYMQEEMARKFFDELEIKQPDEYDYICSVILNRYRFDTINSEGLIDDFMILVQYYTKVRNDEQKLKDYINILRNDLYIYCTDNHYRKGYGVYFSTPILKRFFKGEDEIYFLNEKFYHNIKEHFGENTYSNFFEALGINKTPHICSTKDKLFYDSKGWYNYDSYSKAFRNQLEQMQDVSEIYVTIDYYIKGFENACLNNINKDLSIYLWNTLLSEYECDKFSTCRIKYRRKYARGFVNTKMPSSFILELQSLKWIYDKEGNLCTAKEVIQEDLAPEYHQFNGLIQLLSIEKRQRDLTKMGATEEEQEQFELGAKVTNEIDEDFSEEEALAAIREAKAKKKREKAAVEAKLNNQQPQTDTQTSINTEQSTEETETIDDKLKKRWEEKKNRHTNKPHTKTNNDPELPIDINTPVINSTDNDKPFFVPVTEQTNPDPDIDDTSRAEKNLKTKDTTAQAQAENAKEQVEILNLLNQTPRYTFKWFKVLMELMHAGQQKVTKRNVQIDFSHYDTICSDKILHLTEPSQPVPAWVSDAEKYSITALAEDKTAKIDGLIVKTEDDSIDISIEVNDKMLKDLLSAKKIRVIAVDNTNIIDSLETRFLQLDKEDDFDMNENLPAKPKISFIYGPPGTGKTTELVRQVHNLLEHEPNAKILVLTPTNKAADVVAIKMADDDICEGGLARYGATESLYLIEEIGCVTNRDTTDMDGWHNIIVATAARYAYDFVQPDDTPICDYPWDYIFIDEASMIDILTITYILHKGANAKKIIISGDPKQIRPVVQNDMPDYNIYDMVNLHDFRDAKYSYDRYDVDCLMMQHRSIPSIGDLVSKFAYNGLVEYDPNRAPMKPLTLDGIKIKNINFVGFDVAELDDIKGLNAINNSAFNLYSVIFTYNMVEYTIKQIEKHHPNQDYTIGVVCAYRSQSDAIKNMLENRPLDTVYCKVTCGTVHSFQGDECDIMFIVLNPPANCGEKTHVNNENIINVAMSRARDYIFFVMPNGQQRGFKVKNRLGAILPFTDREIIDCKKIERVMFLGNDNFIYENTHVTCHMPVNVYCEENALYEVRMSDETLDIKINDFSRHTD